MLNSADEAAVEFGRGSTGSAHFPAPDISSPANAGAIESGSHIGSTSNNVSDANLRDSAEDSELRDLDVAVVTRASPWWRLACCAR